MAEVRDKLVDLKSLKVVLDAFAKQLNKMLNDVLANTSHGNVDVVRRSTHNTNYQRDTLEFVTDSTGKVINVYFMSKRIE